MDFEKLQDYACDFLVYFDEKYDVKQTFDVELESIAKYATMDLQELKQTTYYYLMFINRSQDILTQLLAFKPMDISRIDEDDLNKIKTILNLYIKLL